MTEWKKCRVVLMLCAVLGWWGIWFPELAVWPDAVCVAEDMREETSVQTDEKVVECDSAREIYDGLLQADREQIQVRSRLLKLLEQHLRKKSE